MDCSYFKFGRAVCSRYVEGHQQVISLFIVKSFSVVVKIQEGTGLLAVLAHLYGAVVTKQGYNASLLDKQGDLLIGFVKLQRAVVAS